VQSSASNVDENGHDGDTVANRQDFVDPEVPDRNSSRRATAEELVNEQKACKMLQAFFNLGRQNKCGC
jgi:hypothetical protein